LNLLVIRSRDLEQAVKFYSALGLDFVLHSHPPCGEHYSATVEGCVFEICQQHDEAVTAVSTVFGFRVSSVERAVEAALSSGGTLKRPPEVTEWGKTATVADIDGHRVLLTESP
jgi:hypothetical protein